jgi:hypothetical protein
VALCAAEPDHVPPVEGCTCGLRATEDLAELLFRVHVYVSLRATTLLNECGVLGRVELAGKILPGVDIPRDDPPTTWRASQARVLEVQLAPWLSDRADAVQSRYGVPAAVHDAASWPEVQPAPWLSDRLPTEQFLETIRAAGFGSKTMDGDLAPLLEIGRSVCAMLHGGASSDDVGRGLFDSNARPTMQQVRTFLRAATAHLCPECEYAVTGFQFEKPVTMGDTLMRAATNAFMYGGRS